MWEEPLTQRRPELDARDFRSALGCFPTGVCLVTALAPDGARTGLTANSFSSVSIDPPMVLWSLARTASSAPVFRDAEYFVISVLAAGDEELSAHFARAGADKFSKYGERFAAGLAGSHAAFAQVLYGSLVGNVTDPNGAVVPGAAVTATDQGTGIAKTTTTNPAGSYQFVDLQPGVYTVKVAVSGFKTHERRDIPVSLNSVARTDVALEVGSIEQSVTITGEAPTLQTDRAETRAEIGSKELENLPVPIGRNYQQLYRTLPGIAPPVNSHSIPTNPSRSLEFHVNGTSDDQNNTRIDGVSSTTVQFPHVVSYIPALESIQEVNVVTSSYDAEQGLAGGAAINVQIKSGTNQLHGSAFEYHSDQHLKAWPESVPSGQSQRPKLVCNQFGGTAGGPIKKDKLFYFLSYEGSYDYRNVQRKVTVPTDAMRAGDFSQFLSSGTVIYNPYADASGTTLADPAQRAPMTAPGDSRCNTATNPTCANIIPRSLLNTPSGQIAQKINSLWPEPNLP